MGDETTARPVCANCGLPFRDGELRIESWEDPPRYIHDRSRCIRRLTAQLDAARGMAQERIADAMAERDEARRDLAAALAVVRAARIVRVRYRREERAEKLYTRAYYAPGVFPAELAEERRRAYDESCDAREVLVAATTAYVKGGAR